MARYSYPGLFAFSFLTVVGCGGGGGSPADGGASGSGGPGGSGGTGSDAAVETGGFDAAPEAGGAAGGASGQDASVDGAPADGAAGGPATDGPIASVEVVRNALALGEYHTCALVASGAVHCWGQNLASQLGNASAGMGSGTPVPSAGSQAFAAIAAGQQQTCALTAAGQAYCWGTGPELGAGNVSTTAVPLAVTGNLVFRQLTAGRAYTCGVAADGAGYCWGPSPQGELGNDTSPAFPARMPTKVAGTLTFKRIDGGNSDHACGVTTDGSAYCWGANSSGQLGANMKSVPVRMPVAVSTTVKFVAVKPGDLFTCGLGTDAKIYCWGGNGAGQQGNAQPAAGEQLVPTAIAGTETYKEVAVGLDFACGLTTAGAVLCWGDSWNGQLGRGIQQVRPPVMERATPTAVMGGLTFVSLAAGANHACAVTAQGAAHCWGFNTRAEVGDGTNMVRNVPTAVTGGQTFATP